MSSRSENWPDDRIGQILYRAGKWLAIVGGFVLVAMTLLVVVSVIGRAVFLLPVPGDFEIVGIACSVAIFLFLPYCYQQRGNVTVDILTARFPAKLRRAFDVIAALLFVAVSGLFAWRMLFGLVDTFRFEDISMIVGVPLWWAYPFGIASFLLLALSALHTVFHPWSDDDE